MGEPLDPFKNQGPHLFHTSTREIPLIHFECSSLKKYPFRVEHPRTVHYRKNPSQEWRGEGGGQKFVEYPISLFDFFPLSLSEHFASSIIFAMNFTSVNLAPIEDPAS